MLQSLPPFFRLYQLSLLRECPILGRDQAARLGINQKRATEGVRSLSQWRARKERCRTSYSASLGDWNAYLKQENIDPRRPSL
jgi:hypothetical protein